MLIRTRGPHDPLPSELTTPAVWKRRRELLAAAMGGVGLGLSPGANAQFARSAPPVAAERKPLPGVPSPLSTQEKPTPYADVTTYNNFFEFGTEKDEPARHAHRMPTRPWSVVVEGEVRKPGRFDIEDLLKLAPLEERIYRLRCVEGWSMVIPWIGFSLAELIRRVEPTGNARYVAFETLVDRAVMPGVRSPSTLEWPYREGLRLDEAMHPLTLLTFGLFGEVLPNQNGAPIRLVVPWKYGFKSIKSLVRIQFVEKQPVTSWSLAQPREYGFYSNVNPAVSHPRWSQATERRIGEDGVFARKRPTLPFNGYADQVASLYAGMDLSRFY